MWSRNTLKIKRKYKYQICRASSPRLKAEGFRATIGDLVRVKVAVLVAEHACEHFLDSLLGIAYSARY